MTRYACTHVRFIGDPYGHAIFVRISDNFVNEQSIAGVGFGCTDESRFIFEIWHLPTPSFELPGPKSESPLLCPKPFPGVYVHPLWDIAGVVDSLLFAMS